jgi:hypothetical protein
MRQLRRALIFAAPKQSPAFRLMDYTSGPLDSSRVLGTHAFPAISRSTLVEKSTFIACWEFALQPTHADSNAGSVDIAGRSGSSMLSRLGLGPRGIMNIHGNH